MKFSQASIAFCSCFLFLLSCDRKNGAVDDDGLSGSKPETGTTQKHSRDSREGFEAFRSVFGVPNPDSSRVSGIRRSLEGLSESKLLGILDSLDLVSSEADRIMADYVLRTLAAKNPRAALDAIAGLPEQAKAITLMSERYRIMAESQPSVMLDWLAENRSSDSMHVKAAMLPMLLALADLKPDETVQLLSTMDPKRRNVFLASVLWAVSRKDSDLAVRLANEYLKGDDLNNGMISIVKHVGEVDLDKALSIVNSLDGEVSRKCIEGLLMTMLRENNGDVSSLLQRLPAADLQDVLGNSGMVERMVKEDPDKAEEIISGVSFTESNKGIFGRLALSLAASDPVKALDFVKGLPISPASNEIAGRVFETMARTNPDAAVASVATLDAAQQTLAMRGIVRALAKTDVESALGIAAKSDLVYRQDIYREIARTSAYQNPRNAVAIIEDPALSSTIGVDFRNGLINQTVQTWATQDLPAAQQWVEQLPEADAPKGVRGLMTTWMKSDPVSASDWLAKLPAGPTRDAGAKVVIAQIKNTDPEMAAKWRESLTPVPVK